MYSKCGILEAALRAFQRVKDAGVALISDVEIPWNLVLKACIKAKDYEMVHELLERIQLCCGFIDSYSICDILNSCLNPILLNVGTQAQAYMTKRALISHPAVGNCLINIYSGGGKIDDADLAFKSMPEKNSLSWTFIISARVNHGHPSEALDLFKDMQWRYTSMNPTTFSHLKNIIPLWLKLLVELVCLKKCRSLSKGSSKVTSLMLKQVFFKNKIYEFVSNEELTSEVSDKLAEIEENMKELGFVLNRSCLLPTTEEEE
ncbi:hypothetical protein CUMW_197350 [Citrus unshiu]|nr:hypothetical protein CUMW_197350 [Citrus unshiu]